MKTNDSLTPGTMLDNRYEIKRKIKSGGMGAVYEALDCRFDNSTCAIKEMFDFNNPDDKDYMVNRFKQEAQILHSLMMA